MLFAPITGFNPRNCLRVSSFLLPAKAFSLPLPSLSEQKKSDPTVASSYPMPLHFPCVFPLIFFKGAILAVAKSI